MCLCHYFTLMIIRVTNYAKYICIFICVYIYVYHNIYNMNWVLISFLCLHFV